jgi:hypothetical protein
VTAGNPSSYAGSGRTSTAAGVRTRTAFLSDAGRGLYQGRFFKTANEKLTLVEDLAVQICRTGSRLSGGRG